MTFTQAELAFLNEQRLGRLATVAPDGSVQNNPVAFVVDADRGSVDIGGYRMAATRKFRNVLAGSKASLVVDVLVSTRPWVVQGVEIRGRAEALHDQPPPMPGMAGDLIRIYPTRIIGWGLDSDVEGVNARTVEDRTDLPQA
jgi:pyridoxamine 5'-phosphate oxidase family protein